MKSFENFLIEAEPTPADPMATPPDPNAMPPMSDVMGGMGGGGMMPPPAGGDFPPMGGAPGGGGMAPSEPLKPIKVPLTVWEILERLLDGDKI